MFGKKRYFFQYFLLTRRTKFGTLYSMKPSKDPDLTLTVRFYRTENGTEPVREWLKSLPVEHKKAIGGDIKTVQYGWPAGMPVVRKLSTG